MPLHACRPTGSPDGRRRAWIAPEARGVALGAALGALLAACFAPGSDRDGSMAARPARPDPEVERLRVRLATGASSADAVAITERDLLYLLLRRTTRSEVMRLRLRVLAAAGPAAAPGKNPELRVSNLSGSVAEPDPGKLGLHLRWAPPFPTERKARIHRATELAKAEATLVDQEVFDVILRAREHFARLRYAEESLKILRSLRETRVRHLAFRVKRAESGAASRLTADMTEIDLLAVDAQIAAMADERAQHRGELLRLLELRSVRELQTAGGDPSPEAALRPVTDEVRDALARSPAVRYYAHRQRAGRAALWLARKERYPWLDFVDVGYEFDERTLPRSFVLGFSLRLPIFEWNTAAIRLERERLVLDRSRIRAAELRVAGDVETCHERLVEARRALLQFQRDTRPRLEAIRRRARETAARDGVDLDEVYRVEERAYRMELIGLKQALAFRLARIAMDYASAAPVWRAFGFELQEP